VGGAEAAPLRRPRGDRRAAAPGGDAAAAGTAPPVPTSRAGGTPPSGFTGGIKLLLGPVTEGLRLGRPRDPSTEPRLRVDWPQCKAHGLCAELAPEVIHLDEWGYPFIDPVTLDGDELAAVKKAVLACPTLALKLVESPRRTTLP
jgi:ferredoxin